MKGHEAHSPSLAAHTAPTLSAVRAPVRASPTHSERDPMNTLRIGGCRALNGSGDTLEFEMPPHHLNTHSVVFGMTGSGKTGLVMVLVEEALRDNVPVLMVDVKGDLPNL